jgi:nucleotide-binding universal stress UspA family protein
MVDIKKILFPTDFFPCAEQALEHALYLAKKYEAELHMLHATVHYEGDIHNPAACFYDLEEIDQRMKDLAIMEMKSMINSRAEALDHIVMEQKQGQSAADVILKYADRNNIDLIVMGTHGRRGLGHLFLGSVAEEVVRLATCPVLTIRERAKLQQVDGVARILVPVDYSEHSKAALSYAKEIAATYGAKLQMLHVIEETTVPDFYGMGESANRLRLDVLRDRARFEMEEMYNNSPGPDVDTSHHVFEGYATRDIVEFAKNNDSDLIVIATHGLTGIKHLILGSVAEKVVRMAPCPVFTIKAFGTRAAAAGDIDDVSPREEAGR